MQLFHYIFYDLLLLSSFITGCILVRKNWPLEYKLLVILSGLTLLSEFTIEICVYRDPVHHGSWHWIYNYFLPVECAFFIYIFYRASENQVLRRLNIFFLTLLPVGAGILYFLYPDFSKANKEVALLYLFTELICSCSFIIGLLLKQSTIPLTRWPLFWIAFGLLFYSGLYIVMLGIFRALTFTKMMSIYASLNILITNLFLYSGFIICFIRLHKAKTGQKTG